MELLNKQNNKEQGQTLVAVIVLMVLALTVGVVISNRFIRTLRDISQSDNSSKALAVAEAGIERMLLLPNETLEGYINFNNCGTACILEITGALGIKVRADITLSFIGASNDPFELKGKEGEVSQVYLSGYNSGGTLNVCWDDNSSIYASYIYEQSSVVKSNIYAYNPVGYVGFDNGFTNSASAYGHQSCFTVTAVNTPRLLRLKSFSSDPIIYIIPSEGQNLPSQGVLITSTGRAGNAIRVVKVLKATASAPEYFDFVLYQKSTTDPLSNRSN
jgi:hypothetical protein